MSIQDRFNEFHHANPWVYDLFKRFASQALSTGALRISGKFIIERIRWEHLISPTPTPGAGGFKINDHFTSRYVRKFCDEYPSVADRFETRAIVTP